MGMGQSDRRSLHPLIALAVGLALPVATVFALLNGLLDSMSYLAVAVILSYPTWAAQLGKLSRDWAVSALLAAMPPAVAGGALVLSILGPGPVDQIRWGDYVLLVPSMLAALLVLPVATRVAVRWLADGHPWRALGSSSLVVAIGLGIAALPFTVVLLGGHTGAA